MTSSFPYMVVVQAEHDSHAAGDLTFAAPPHVGEFVTKEKDGVELNYRVTAVVHTPDYHLKTCGLLYVKLVGDNGTLHSLLRVQGGHPFA